MSRLPKLAPAELSAEQRRVYDAIVGGPRNRGRPPYRLADDEGRLEGPFNLMLFSPTVGFALQELGASIRFGSVLPDRLREVAILTVAAWFGSPYEWYSHAAMAGRYGITEQVLATLRRGATPPLEDHRERLAHRLTLELLDHRTLTEQSFRAADDAFGSRGAVELVVMVGYYSLLAVSMAAFGVGLPDGVDAAGARELPGTREPPGTQP